MPHGRETGRTPRLGYRAADVDLVGRDLGGWHVDDVIAAGGFGVVYAVTRDDGRRGALKALHAHLVESPDMVGRLLREAQAIARLRHPAVVELLDTGVADDGRPYLVMELLEGVDLARSLRETGRRTPAQVLTIVEPLCAALALAHEHGIVHRDLKASNVFLCRPAGREPGRVVLLDFGIAKLADGLDLTRSQQVIGTPASMAPEQIRGEPVDARADVYGLGALIFHLLTGRMPFDDASMTMSQYLHLHAQRPSVSAIAPVPAALDAVVSRAMAIEPAARFGGPLPLLSALRAALDDRPWAREEVAASGVALSVRRRAGDAADP
jgi:eukaryotic-like serine/threonine-protein kinase